MAERTTINDAIRRIMKENKFTLAMMAECIGKNRPNDVSARLASGNLTFNSAIEMLEKMGYEVTVQRKPERGNRPNGQYIIEKYDPEKNKKSKKDGKGNGDAE